MGSGCRISVEINTDRPYQGVMITAIFAARDVEIPLAYALQALVPAAMEGVLREVIVIDRGSNDGTADVADAAGCEVVKGSETLEDDLRVAAERARSDWLLFLSPTSVLESGWHSDALEFIDRSLEAGTARSCAAVFRLGRGRRSPRSRMAEGLATFRTRALAAPYEEQGLLIPRALYRSLGGRRNLTAMAEVDLTRRIGRRRLTLLGKHAMARVPREGTGGIGRAVRNATCLALFVLRLPPSLIGRLAG